MLPASLVVVSLPSSVGLLSGWWWSGTGSSRIFFGGSSWRSGVQLRGSNVGQMH